MMNKPGIGHNSVQIPHDGKLVAGATHGKKRHMFRPTEMSLAMAAAGIIPGSHLVSEMAVTLDETASGGRLRAIATVVPGAFGKAA